MLTKTQVALLAASLLLTPFGVVYGADTQTDKATPEMKATAKDNLTEWSKEDAKKNGVTEAQFKAADKNGDGKLDQEEINAAGLQPRDKTSK
jgi:EF hand